MSLDNYIISKLHVRSTADSLKPFPEGNRILNILHQTYASTHDTLLPHILQENIDKIKSMNPDLEYRLYDDADIVEFVKNNYDSRIFQYFNHIHPKYSIAKVDLFRYLLIYKCGGVYLNITGC